MREPASISGESIFHNLYDLRMKGLSVSQSPLWIHGQ